MIQANQKPKSVLDLNCTEAQAFFLKHESYFNADLPPYFNFETILSDVASELEDKPLKSVLSAKKPRDYDDVNHVIIANKDGQLSWRPFQLIHPVLYVDLVREITKQENWDKLKARLLILHSCDNIKCLSMPLEAPENIKDRAEQVSQWWQEVELKSVEYSLDYEYLYEADIADCYGSFYTHSIAWAVESKSVAKIERSRNNLGNYIDKAIQNMQHGQTNGIPQGSVLMDFIAELVLGYVDLKVANKIDDSNINDFKILRYRDDYRIFVNSSEDGEKILKVLSEVLTELGLRLNSNKTKFSSDVVGASIKEDKKAWIVSKGFHRSLFKHAMLIKQHADFFPNSGSLTVALSKFHKRTLKLEEVDTTSKAIVSVIVDIAYKNPRTYPVCFAILSKFISLLDDRSQNTLIRKIQNKFTKLNNVGYMEVWFQRAIKNKLKDVVLNEPLCKLVKGEKVNIWNSEWISSCKLTKLMDSADFIDKDKLDEAEPIINSLEFNLFSQASG
ncbi:RNA-directed DNA polymerase [Marinospirillum minutulum]|uniref:RNA-directed DNA polymerase n=1 Tax=Marinospirillum minutulum TaxID=64974 RepID=UPI000425B356|nr:RNA-directed DNA polymerase [Marinospirillum minutulum]